MPVIRVTQAELDARRAARGTPAEAPAVNAAGQLSADDLHVVHSLNRVPDEGLGDSVARLASAIGADRLAALYERVSGHSCGCGWRRKFLNRLFPYTRPDARR